MANYSLTRSLLAFCMRPCGCSLRYDWWIISIATKNSWLPSGNQYPEIEWRRYDTHGWQCCRRETYNPGSKRGSNHNWFSWPSLQSWENPFSWESLLWLIFCSSLLERSSFLQTCTILRRLAKGCVHTIQRWWVLVGCLSKCYSSDRCRRPSSLSRKKVSLLFLVVLSVFFSPASYWSIFLLLKKRFSETEAIAALTMFVSRYKITIKEELQFAGETFEKRKTRVLKCWSMVTLTWVLSIIFFKFESMI